MGMLGLEIFAAFCGTIAFAAGIAAINVKSPLTAAAILLTVFGVVLVVFV